VNKNIRIQIKLKKQNYPISKQEKRTGERQGNSYKIGHAAIQCEKEKAYIMM